MGPPIDGPVRHVDAIPISRPIDLVRSVEQAIQVGNLAKFRFPVRDRA